MSERLYFDRTYYPDDWGCFNHGCKCMIDPIDIEKDKQGLANIFGRRYQKVEVSYSEYTETEGHDKGRVHKYYHVSVDNSCVLMDAIRSAEFHGLMLRSIHSGLGYQMRTKLSFIFERVEYKQYEPKPSASEQQQKTAATTRGAEKKQ